jgi:hypothetical protein
MKNHVAAALLGLCLTAGGASASDEVASMSASRSATSSSPDSFASHQHSPAFLGFMSKHDKKYCDGDHACEVSILREKIWKLNQEFVNAHNSNPGAYSADEPSIEERHSALDSTPLARGGGARLRRVGARRERDD